METIIMSSSEFEMKDKYDVYPCIEITTVHEKDGVFTDHLGAMFWKESDDMTGLVEWKSVTY